MYKILDSRKHDIACFKIIHMIQLINDKYRECMCVCEMIFQTEVQLGIVVGKLVKEFVDKQDFTQELVFEPKVPCCVRRAVATHAAQSGLHMAQRQKEGRLYLALSFKVPMTKVQSFVVNLYSCLTLGGGEDVYT